MIFVTTAPIFAEKNDGEAAEYCFSLTMDRSCGNGASVSGRGPDSNLFSSREHAGRPHSRNTRGILRPGNQAELVRLH